MKPLLLTSILFAIGCSHVPANQNANAVLNAHSKELMAIPGVRGVYLGLMKDEKTECVKVMVADEAAAKKVPRRLDGVSVVTEISGEIKPL